MSEIRRDPITGRSVIIAPERAERPNEFQNRPAAPRGPQHCPFCPGHEAETPPEILSYQLDGAWRLRVVPNKYPALWAHEVIIETPDHNLTLADVPLDRAVDVFRCFRNRILHLKQDNRLRYVMIFKNQGEAAGATIEHTHTQLLALPMTPALVLEELERAREYWEGCRGCIYCDRMREEPQERVVLESADFVVISPYVARFPFETWILPKRHHSHFEAIESNAIADLAAVFQSTLRRINKALDRPAYNMVIQTAPIQETSLAHYHWRIELIPRLNKIGGFEWGTGVYINPTPPEEAARRLRLSPGE